jgi:hypothetical protein
MGNQTQLPSLLQPQPQQQKPVIGAAPPPPLSVPGKTPYQGPPVSGSQIEGRSGGTGGGKLSNIMKKMKEGPSANREGAVNYH